MKRKSGLLVLCALVALLLTGCGLKSPEDLYTLPKTTSEYENLQSCLEELILLGYEYAAPTSGSNTQSVQLEDIDGDGEDEAIAFFRDSSGGEHPMKICIFRANGSGGYTLAATIEGDGDAINSVVYCQLNDSVDSKGNRTEEIVVGWRISSSVYALSAYSIENDNVTQVMTASSYNRYVVYDMDQDNLSEIVLIQLDTTEGNTNCASYYDWSEENALTLVNTVSLSVSIESLDALQRGYLAKNVPAVYLTGTHSESSSTLLTDILTVADGNLINLTMDSETNDSDTAHLSITTLKDINADNVLELPMTVALSSSSFLDRSESFNAIRWVQYSEDGSSHLVCYTYHNVTDGWYFTLSGTWINNLVLNREDTNVGATVERNITFYYQADGDSEPEAFLTIYKNSGTNRTSRAVMGNRFMLADDGDAIYSAELIESDWNSGLTEETVLERFQLILTDWSTD